MMSQRIKRLTFAATVVLATVGAVRVGLARDDELINDARQTVANFRRADPSLDQFFSRSAAYVVFPGVGKGGYLVGGAHGTGVLFEGGVPAGKVTLNQVTVGAQVGGQEYAEIMFLETPRVVADFKAGKINLSAQASAVALSDGAAAIARFKNGVAIFTKVKGGLMAEASVGGQQFKFQPFGPTR